MITQEIYIPKYKWTIHAYYAVTTYYVDEIMEHLWRIGIDGQSAKNAYDNLRKNSLDSGLCYSNYANRETIIVVAKTSSAEEFLNSMVHEASHACTHIATAMYVNLKGEDFAYMVGDLCMEMYPKVKGLICDCCRNKQKHKHYE